MLDSQKMYMPSPLHDKEVLLRLVKKQQIGRRAYSDITKVKTTNRKTALYEKKNQKYNEAFEVF